jgi:nucleolar protein 12
MLPRTLRVGRCKAPHKTARAAEAKAAKAAILAGVKPNGRDNKKRKSVSDYVPKPTGEAQTLAGRAGKLLGRAGGAKAAGRTDGKKGDRRASRRASGTDNNKGTAAAAAGDGEAAPAFKSPEEVIFEGRRASAKDGKPKDLRFKGSRPAGKAGGPKRPGKSAKDGRGGVRAAKWRAQGGSKREKK